VTIDMHCVQCVSSDVCIVAVLETYGKLREQMANKRSVLFSGCLYCTYYTFRKFLWIFSKLCSKCFKNCDFL